MRNNWVMAVLGVVLEVGMAAGEAAAFSASYDQKATQGRAVYASKVSVKNEFFRMETTMRGESSLIIHNAEGTFTVMPSQGMAMKMSQLRPGQGAIQGADNYAQYLQRQHAEKTGSETIDGRACDIYRFTDSETGEVTTAWVATDIMFPIRLEVEGAEGKMLVELSNNQLGAAISDDAFQLPDGVQVMDMGAMMGGMGLR